MIPPEIKEQILAIRASGETNMFDIPAVRRIALREGYIELYRFLERRKRAYARFILYGERDEKDE